MRAQGIGPLHRLDPASGPSMSVTIAPGFAIRTVDARDLHDIVFGFSDTVRRMAEEAHSRLLASLAASAIDLAVCGRAPWPDNALARSWRTIDDAGSEIDRTGYANPRFDFSFKTILIPDRHTGSTYGIVYSPKPEWRTSWMEQDGVSDFSYWDAERPKSVSARDWSARRATWARIMPTWTPDRHGFSASLLPTRMLHHDPDPLRLQPSLEERKTEVAWQLAIDEFVMARPEAERDTAAATISLVMKARSHYEAPAGAERLASIRQSLLLPKSVTHAIATSRDRPREPELELA